MSKKTVIRSLLLLLALVLLCMPLGCSEDAAPNDTQQGEDSALPKLENNEVAKVPFTAMWYRPDMMGEGVEITDAKTVHKILALFNNVTFTPLTEDQLKEVYLEMAEGQFIMLEGGATVYVSDAGRAMFTQAEVGQFVCEKDTVDAAKLRTIIAEFNAGKSDAE